LIPPRVWAEATATGRTWRRNCHRASALMIALKRPRLS